MRDLFIQTAGAVAMFAAIVHAMLGETKIFAKAHIEPARIELLIRLVWRCSAVAWAAIGVLLVVVPYMASEVARHWMSQWPSRHGREKSCPSAKSELHCLHFNLTDRRYRKLYWARRR